MLSTGVPDEPTRQEIRALAAAVERADGAPPLSDQTLTQLGSAAVTHLITRADGRLTGYAQRDGDDAEIAAEAAEVPELLAALPASASAAGPRLWTHGRHSRLIPILTEHGYRRIRDLHQLRRPLAELPADPALPDGVTVRAFVPGQDDADWLAINAAAFAQHAEQGRWTQRDLAARLAEPWFEAAGFLLAVRDGQLLGYHWTKVHPDGAGEVYVLGVAPGTQGLGLGNALLVRGLRHLRGRGCPEVLLYVDGDNPGAVRLYERAGFTSYDLDVQWEHPASVG